MAVREPLIGYIVEVVENKEGKKTRQIVTFNSHEEMQEYHEVGKFMDYAKGRFAEIKKGYAESSDSERYYWDMKGLLDETNDFCQEHGI